MATMSKPVSYEYEFVEQVPEHYYCKKCKHVAREPNITSCCAQVFCKNCMDLIIENREPCPRCDNEVKSLGPHTKYHSRILALEIHCVMKNHGCQWTGQLQYLDAHLFYDCQHNIQLCDFTLFNYNQLKFSNQYCDSPPIYTHPNGYKFKVTMYPNGSGSNHGINMSVYVYSLESDHDAELQFPVEFTIILQLLNQYRDQDHYTRHIRCKIEMKERVGMSIGISLDRTFIPQADLHWNGYSKIQYLKDDCLRFRITRIVLHY